MISGKLGCFLIHFCEASETLFIVLDSLYYLWASAMIRIILHNGDSFNWSFVYLISQNLIYNITLWLIGTMSSLPATAGPIPITLSAYKISWKAWTKNDLLLLLEDLRLTHLYQIALKRSGANLALHTAYRIIGAENTPFQRTVLINKQEPRTFE